ncbi:MAG: methyltransferase domain-containing protein [Planctomycetes bacterium]|nr:methyltransferase domain-containing protein [Planctomycetota bacterium]
MPTREEATGFPRGDVRLVHCASCGFVANAAFDVTNNAYSTRYEETQGFSPTFNAFADRLAKRLVDEYGVRGRRVLEIGCGKGEFLERVCRFGDNQGIGVDPAYRPERTPDDVRDKVTYMQELYADRHADLRPDVVVCRHTLEHIAPTREFLRRLRGHLEARPDVLVFFELPETLRVLRECAFWDVYYEHCSYFTPGSLARLFRAEGFELLELSLDFGDQYILIMARSADGPTRPSLPLEDDLDETARLVAHFEREAPRQLEAWRARVRGWVAAGRKVAIWGSGSKAVAFLTTLGLGDEIAAMVDVNPHKQGKFMPGTGHEVLAPERLVDVRPDDVIVMNAIYTEEIRAHLQRMGLQPDLHPA